MTITSNKDNSRFLELLKISEKLSKNNKTPKEVYDIYFEKQSQSEENIAFDIDGFAKEFDLEIEYIIKNLSKRFQVSGVALVFRLKELGIINRWMWIDV